MGGIIAPSPKDSSLGSVNDRSQSRMLSSSYNLDVFSSKDTMKQKLERQLSTSICTTSNTATIDASVVFRCKKMWEAVKTNFASNQFGNRLDGVHQFCSIFFDQLKTNYDDKEFYDRFSPGSRSRIPNRSVLLQNIVKYMISAPDDSFPVKSKIRAMGRAHARRGITEEHFKAFNQCFMMTLLIIFEGEENSDQVEKFQSWGRLLQFMFEQLTFEKVVFVSHNFSNSNMDTRSGSTRDATSTSIQLLKTPQIIGNFRHATKLSPKNVEGAQPSSWRKISAFLATPRRSNSNIMGVADMVATTMNPTRSQHSIVGKSEFSGVLRCASDNIVVSGSTRRRSEPSIQWSMVHVPERIQRGEDLGIDIPSQKQENSLKLVSTTPADLPTNDEHGQDEKKILK